MVGFAGIGGMGLPTLPQVSFPRSDVRLRSQRRLEIVAPVETFASRNEVANCGTRFSARSGVGRRNVFFCRLAS